MRNLLYTYWSICIYPLLKRCCGICMQTTKSGCYRHRLSVVLGFLTAMVLSINSWILFYYFFLSLGKLVERCALRCLLLPTLLFWALLHHSSQWKVLINLECKIKPWVIFKKCCAGQMYFDISICLSIHIDLINKGIIRSKQSWQKSTWSKL